jgi:hypothetical protein
MLAAHGVSNFFGNLMSAAFVGDFSNAARWLELSNGVRYAATAVGGIGVVTVLYLTGRELARWSSKDWTKIHTVMRLIVGPAVIATALVCLVNQPAPIPGFVPARAGEAAMWLFAILGLWTAAKQDGAHTDQLQLRWADGVAAILTIAAVRVFALGIPLG